MGLFDASTSASGNSSQSSNFSNASSSGATYGSAASAQALANMREANAFTERMWERQADYNSKEAQKTREWQERLANTTYQRTMQDMIKAGINPILAAGAGLSADSVTSGATASVAGATGQALGAYPDSMNSSLSHAEGQSSGRGWSSSESGFATFLKSMAEIFGTISNGLSSGLSINIDNSFDKLYDKLFPPETQTKEDKEVKESIHEANESKKTSNTKKYKGNNTEYSGGLPRTGARGEDVVM